MARIRTIPKAVAELKKNDPDCCVTVWGLRRWIKEGRIPYVKAGKTFLIDLDKLNEYVQTGCGV